ncbi:phage major capsid protein [Bacillus cereus group sp. BfR-BA-01380]|uniref:phage major capsid protein n=1 Tax=Bacillus cereus group sp. BfR-BA-01380 TaxID=2920324 RepID=UPI001F59CA81|nr:phage major capsid protein [Bacillus cereus group sp. BfR-BA-01380]
MTKLLPLNLQFFAEKRSLADVKRDLEKIEDKKFELRKELRSDNASADLKEIEKELDEISEKEEKLVRERRSLEADAINNGTGGRTISSINFSTGSIANDETFEDGHKILTRSQSLSDMYPNSDKLSLGKYLRGAITGDWLNAQKEQNEFRSLSTATSSVLIPQVLSSQVIDTARNQSILFQSGVPMLPMESNNVTISKVKTDPQFSFKAEGADSSESVMEFEPVTLKSKTVYGLVSVTLEALQSSANLESVVRNAMAESIARTIDKACLFGNKADEPKGVLNYADINEEAAGTSKGYSPFVKAIGKIRRANGDPTAWALNANTDEDLNLLVDSNGNPLIIPQVVENLNRMVSNQLPNNGGAGSNESTAMIFDPNSLLIGMQSPIMVEVSREALDAWKKGLVYLRVYAMIDIAVLRPKHITKITGLKSAV